MKLIAVDVETGGQDPSKHSLLSLYAEILEFPSLRSLDSIEMKIKPVKGVYNVVPQALEINKIDLVQHSTTAINDITASGRLHDFMRKHVPANPTRNDLLIPFGHNVAFDVAFIKAQLAGSGWSTMTTWNVLDTSTCSLLLYSLGVQDYPILSLSKLCERYDVTRPITHDAKWDVKATITVLRNMLRQHERYIETIVNRMPMP